MNTSQVEHIMNDVIPENDLDADGISDEDEILFGIDPNNTDTDGDGLNDGEELRLYLLNPLVVDTDGDEMPDGWEVENGFNPLSHEDADMDEDGLNAYQEGSAWHQC